jgi:hypothetical protein
MAHHLGKSTRSKLKLREAIATIVASVTRRIWLAACSAALLSWLRR